MSPIFGSFSGGRSFGYGSGGGLVDATGGVLHYDKDGYAIHSFIDTYNNVGDQTFQIISGEADIEYLVVAGGGGGGGWGGGGGGGGYRSSVVGQSSGGGAGAEPVLSLGVGSYSVRVGDGGLGGTYNYNTGDSGGESFFHTITSVGGGGGGAYAGQSGLNGGSGGGGGGSEDYSGNIVNPAGSGTTNQGYPGEGGRGRSNPYNYYLASGGGGGAGEKGFNESSYDGGRGGIGVESSITGAAQYRAAGGAGHGHGGILQVSRLGGGASGSNYPNNNWGKPGAPNTGGGGGGAYQNTNTPKNTSQARGGSGIVVVRYESGVSKPPAGYHNEATTFNAGTQWFSPGYFGVMREDKYKLQNGATYNACAWRRNSLGDYHWWLLFVEDLGSNQYQPIYGALIRSPSAVFRLSDSTFQDYSQGVNGESIMTWLDSTNGAQNYANRPTSTFGSRTIPASGNYFIAWLSTAPGYSAPSGSIWFDSGSGGSCEYIQTSVAPSTSTTYTTTSGSTGNNAHISCFRGD